jgi:hypothetical protein
MRQQSLALADEALGGSGVLQQHAFATVAAPALLTRAVSTFLLVDSGTTSFDGALLRLFFLQGRSPPLTALALHNRGPLPYRPLVGWSSKVLEVRSSKNTRDCKQIHKQIHSTAAKMKVSANGHMHAEAEWR